MAIDRETKAAFDVIMRSACASCPHVQGSTTCQKIKDTCSVYHAMKVLSTLAEERDNYKLQVDVYREEINELKDELRWNTSTEETNTVWRRMGDSWPEYYGTNVLVTDGKKVYVGKYVTSQIIECPALRNGIIAWAPLPTPYRGK